MAGDAPIVPVWLTALTFITCESQQYVACPWHKRRQDVADPTMPHIGGGAGQQDLKLVAISVLVTLLAVLVPFFAWQWHRTARALNDSQRGSNGGAPAASQRGSGSTLELLASAVGGGAPAGADQLPAGWRLVGNIAYDPRHVLGRGCEGTLVYKGRFDGRDVAVKRMLPDCFSVADKEVQLLRLSDQHLNVVRYYCTEQDAHFRYIALELCDATVVDYAKEASPGARFGLEPASVLKQALSGLQHLHNLDIVHRDLKPTNLLLCKTAGASAYRTVISDFGLCKRLSPGRVSFSKRSGLTGTEGWIAPEMFETASSSATCAVDIFSAGCVCYFVLSRGRHPFGDALNRQRNILDGTCNLGALRLDHPQDHLATDMIMKMIEHRAMDRLSIDGALKHPFFWSAEEQMHFLTEASDRTDKLPMDDALMERLESCSPTVCGLDWSLLLDARVYENLVTFRGYRTHRLVDLLRAIRNKRNHFRDLGPEVQALLGRSADQYVGYFTGRYPQLLTYLYNVMTTVKWEHSFERYYSILDPDYFPKYYRAQMKSAYIKDSEVLGTSLSSNQIARAPRGGDSSPQLTRRNPPLGGRGACAGSWARHSDSELSVASSSAAAAAAAAASSSVAAAVPNLSAMSFAAFRSPPMQRLQRKAAEQQKQQQAMLLQLQHGQLDNPGLEPPGLTRSQDDLKLPPAADQGGQQLEQAQAGVVFTAGSYPLFRIDSYPHGTEIPQIPAASSDPSAAAPALAAAAKKKTRRGKKAKKSASASALASPSASFDVLLADAQDSEE